MMITTLTLNPAVDKTFYVNGFQWGHVNKAVNVHATAGAKGINVSRVLQALGADTLAMGFAGGPTGELLLQLLKKEGVDYEYVPTSAQTRLNTKILDLKTNTFTELNEPGHEITMSELHKLMVLLEERLPISPYVVLGGSIPQGLEEDIYYHIIQKIVRHGCKVFLDCGGQLLKEAIEAKPYFVKPNLEEFNEMIGQDCGSLKEAIPHAREIIGKEVSMLVITDGPNGALAVNRDGTYQVNVPNVEAKSTVGAGDSFLAGFVYSISREEDDFVTALKTAASCSVAKVACDSSEVPEKAELLSYMDEVEIIKI